MYQIILLIHSILAIALIGLVLIQHGKGAQIGAAFGSGASQTVFGSQGTGSFLMKVTVLLAAGVFTTSITLSLLAAARSRATLAAPTSVTQQSTTQAPIVPPVEMPAENNAPAS